MVERVRGFCETVGPRVRDKQIAHASERRHPRPPGREPEHGLPPGKHFTHKRTDACCDRGGAFFVAIIFVYISD